MKSNKDVEISVGIQGSVSVFTKNLHSKYKKEQQLHKEISVDI